MLNYAQNRKRKQKDRAFLFVCYAKDNGIINGYPDGLFRPGNKINKAEGLKISSLVFGVPIPEKATGEEWFNPYWTWAKDNEIDPYDDSIFTKDDMAKFLKRAETVHIISQIKATSYSVISTVPDMSGIVLFSDTDVKKSFELSVKNSGTTGWNLNKVELRQGDPMDITGSQLIKTLDKNLEAGGEWKINFELSRPANLNEWEEKTFFLVTTENSQKMNGQLIKWKLLYAGEKRNFKKSKAGIVIQDKTIVKGYKSLNKDSWGDLAIKTPVIVYGKAIQGEYADNAKTDRWYLVEYNGVVGYIEATFIHPEFIDFQPYNKCDLDRGVEKRLQQIVLHSTGGFASAPNEAANSKGCIKAHFYVDRVGTIVQIQTVDKLLHHAGFEESQQVWHPNIEDEHSFNSIGIELVNRGVILEESEKIKNTNYLFQSAWTSWISGWKWGEGSETSKNFQNFTSDQYLAVDQLLRYIEESTGIPYQVFKYSDYKESDGKGNKNFEYGYYYFPFDSDLNRLTSYYEKLNSFPGVISHHNATGKWDTGPAFNLCDENLNFSNINRDIVCVATEGVCGSIIDRENIDVIPTENLCKNGFIPAVEEGDSDFSWICPGEYGGKNTNCSINKLMTK